VSRDGDCFHGQEVIEKMYLALPGAPWGPIHVDCSSRQTTLILNPQCMYVYLVFLTITEIICLNNINRSVFVIEIQRVLREAGPNF
jgi:hypothetical protein